VDIHAYETSSIRSRQTKHRERPGQINFRRRKLAGRIIRLGIHADYLAKQIQPNSLCLRAGHLKQGKCFAWRHSGSFSSTVDRVNINGTTTFDYGGRSSFNHDCRASLIEGACTDNVPSVRFGCLARAIDDPARCSIDLSVTYREKSARQRELGVFLAYQV
jgi:hypothetical protein